jgi:hypothetical protein
MVKVPVATINVTVMTPLNQMALSQLLRKLKPS